MEQHGYWEVSLSYKKSLSFDLNLNSTLLWQISEKVTTWSVLFNEVNNTETTKVKSIFFICIRITNSKFFTEKFLQ